LSTSITLRAATEQDAAAIAALLTQLNRVENNPNVVEAAPLAEALASAEPLRALVACDAETVIAVVLYYRGYDVLTAAYGYHLADFVVDEAYRHQGIGKRLFAMLAAENLDMGGEWISLTVLRENRDAQAFYAALGMAHVPVDFFAIGKRALTALTEQLQK
jgi:GNAT superfamily N-acetyltransferase